MRVPVVALVLLASLSACAMPPTPAYLSPGRYETGPLRAQLLPRGLGGVSFQVNRPAYVAVFEVNPGGGIAMLHPRFGEDALAVRSGVHNVWRSWAHHARSRGATYSQISGWGSYPIGSWNQRPSQMLQPRMYLLIASEQPLEVSRYVHSTFALQMALGGRAYAASPYALADHIAQLVVPNYHAADWVSDVYFEWPEPVYEDVERIPTHVLVCRDGSRLLAPVYIRACPQDTTPVPPLATDTAATPVEGRPQRPDRRRPERAGIREGGQADATSPEVIRPERGVRPGRVRDTEGRETSRPTREVERPSRAEPRDARPTRTDRTREAREAERSREPTARPETRERPFPRAQPPESNSPPRAEPAPRAQPSEPSASPRPAPAPRSEPQARPAPPPRSEPAPPRAEPRVEPSSRSSEEQPPSFR